MTVDQGQPKSSIFKKEFWTGRKRKVGEAVSGHNDSIDDVPPPGLENVKLTGTKSLPKPPDLPQQWWQKD